MQQDSFFSSLQQSIASNNASWVAAPSPFEEGQLEVMCGANMSDSDKEERLAALQAIATTNYSVEGLPSSFDLRNVNGANYVSNIEYQGSCGSCVAFGTLAAIEGRVKYQARNPNMPFKLSEAHLFYGHAAAEGRNCGNGLPFFHGWFPDRALIAVQQKGVVSDRCFSYSSNPIPTQLKLCSNWASELYHIQSHRKLTNIADIKKELVENGPVISCLTVYKDFENYKSGVYTHTFGIEIPGGHCVCIVGYDDAQGCWIGKNSWSSGWGEGGYFRIKYGECFIDGPMWAPYV